MSNMTDRKEVQILPEGVFLVTLHKLSMKAIRARRSRLQSEIMRLHREQASLRQQMNENLEKIDELERQLAALNSRDLKEWIANREREKLLAEQKADEFLKQYVGDEGYKQLKEKGFIEFEASDGRAYKVDDRGQVYRNNDGSWERLCVIRPSELPLPDFIVSVLTSVKNRPKEYAPRR